MLKHSYENEFHRTNYKNYLFAPELQKVYYNVIDSKQER